MPGTWEKPARLSLLRNKGGGVFEDVTVAAGLAEPISTVSAGWGDYDNDGKRERERDFVISARTSGSFIRSPRWG
jgi:hypothetical protein